ncbi:calcium-binding protein [Pleomorphomonas carboxyditropha]|uniref:Calcium-binding protein n=1 Tax=Pleomorphomonas carboxyditropha TaxID=2023338 RepID=A0A2G9X0Z5_9HYPH|nr:calcium-binding protein [Pleomorphomonas carboxyditropha]PIP00584.1 hypothetical protein CJ014_00310 [Pleomorphomonas carboxyditropha]
MPTFNGTSGNDTMDYRAYNTPPPPEYTPDMQWLILNGLEGNDTIYGSVYNDAIYGGGGDDVLVGNSGHDYLNGGSGDDLIYGGIGNDSLYGDIGEDHLYGEAGDDWLDGGEGNDYMEGGAGNDVLVGGGGSDFMFGQAGNDQFFGDAGADILDGGAGSDQLWGGSGNDQYQYNGQGFDYINDGVTNTGAARTDNTYDSSDVLIVSYTAADLGYAQDGNDLWFFSWADYSNDNRVDNAVIIEGFFLGGHYTVEYLVTADGAGPTYDLTTLLAA